MPDSPSEHPVTDAIAAAPDAARAVLAEWFERARSIVPETTEGTSYGLAALPYRGKALIAITTTAKGYSVYPFSSAVVTAASAQLGDLPHSKGAVTFTDTRPLPTAAFDTMVAARRAEIDAALERLTSESAPPERPGITPSGTGAATATAYAHPMQSNEALDVLVRMLSEDGVTTQDPRPGDAQRALHTMRRFADIHISDVDYEADGDMVLLQYGTYRRDDREWFEVDLVRQMIPRNTLDQDEPEDEDISQLHCTLLFSPTPERRDIGAFDVWLAGPDAEEEWEQALAMPGFTVSEAPQEITVYIDLV